MPRQEIDLTTPQPNGKMGEPTKSAWEKVNDMTAEIYASIGASSQLPGRNMLINCGVPINQRGFAGGALAAGAYGYDRWKGGSGGCNITINSTTGVFSHNSGNLVQVVESPIAAWGQPLTFSVENPSGNISVNVGGSIGTITSGSGRRSVTVTPSGSGNMSLQITATGVTYSRPQLERGTSASTFDYRFYQHELILCQRYYENSFSAGNAPANGAVGHCYQASGFSASMVRIVEIPFAVRKRAVPSITAYTDSLSSSPLTGGMSIFISGAYMPGGIIGSANTINQDGWSGDIDYGSGITPGYSYLARGNWAADCEL